MRLPVPSITITITITKKRAHMPSAMRLLVAWVSKTHTRVQDVMRSWVQPGLPELA